MLFFSSGNHAILEKLYLQFYDVLSNKLHINELVIERATVDIDQFC